MLCKSHRWFSRYNYERTPVRPGTGEVRLLHLELAKDRAEPLRCRLEVVSLEAPPKYATLSYCWGKQRNMVRLEIDGQCLFISESVDDALRSVRALKVRKIWVDQICINQNNLSERNDQILLMKDIYSGSRECFVYLGKGTGKEHVMELEQLKQYVKAHRGRLGSLGLEGWWKIANGAFSTIERKRTKTNNEDGVRYRYSYSYRETPWQRCMRDLISQPYFSRSWVIQELRFSRVITCLWGRCTLDWDLVRACAKKIPVREGLSANSAFQQMPPVLAWAGHKSNANFWELDTQTSRHAKELAKALHRFNRFVELLESFTEQPRQPLFSIMIASRSLRVTDERDKIFALLGLAHDRADFPSPDYNWNRKRCFVYSRRSSSRRSTLHPSCAAAACKFLIDTRAHGLHGGRTPTILGTTRRIRRFALADLQPRNAQSSNRTASASSAIKSIQSPMFAPFTPSGMA
jgi:hypothetical protein